MENTEFEPWSREWVIQQHREMYHWIAAEIRKNGVTQYLWEYEKQYMRNNGINPDEVNSHCFTCEYVFRLLKSYSYTCDTCPLDWKSVSRVSTCDNGGLWQQLKDAIEYTFENPYRIGKKRCVKLAKKIAEVPAK